MSDSKSTTLITGSGDLDESFSIDGTAVRCDEPHLERGTAFGRYVILDMVGSGGMGVVYAAYDPSLDRKVALKVLRPEVTGKNAEQRLLREAQAMARLQHPNVVAVHDVGSHEGQTYLAMEFIDGADLRSWLHAKERSWQEIVGVFSAAGRGLAAAHASGLVHRDLKPSNIMIGVDGRARVADFGLARVHEDLLLERSQTPLSDGDLEEDTGVSPLEAPLTREGALLGTPAFMPPEQIERRRVDPLSDQFSFCVSLFIALYGIHPFGQPATMSAFALRMREGEVEVPTDTRGVPRRIHDSILRGLRCDPEERFPNMDKLVAALSGGSEKRRRRTVMAVAGAVVAAAVSAGVILQFVERSQLCAGGGELVAEVWNNGRRTEIEASFAQLTGSVGARVSREVGGMVDSYTGRWLAAYSQACEATRIHGQQSESVLDRQMACLALRLREADELLNLFSTADLGLLAGSSEAVLGLSSPESCTDVAAQLRRAPLPEDPDTRARIAAAEQRLAGTRARYLAGDFSGVLEDMREIVADAESLDYAPLLAEALRQRGAAQVDLAQGEEAAMSLRASLVAAEQGGVDAIAVSAASDLLWTLGAELHRFDEIDHVFAVADAKLEWVGERRELEADLLMSMAGALLVAGRYDEALALQENAVSLIREEHGEDGMAMAVGLHALGNTLSAVGRPEVAVDYLEQALELKQAHLDPQHPSLASTLTSLSQAYYELGRYEEALVAAESAVEITEGVFGSDHPRMATPLNNVAGALHGVGRLDDAVSVHLRNARLIRSSLGDGHPQLVSTYLNLAALYHQLGEAEAAVEAARECERIAGMTLGEQHPMYAYAANNLGVLLMYAGKPSDAVKHLERALAIRTEESTDPVLVAVTRFNLGRSLWDSGETAAGRRQVVIAREILVGAGDRGRYDLDAVDAWLAEP